MDRALTDSQSFDKMTSSEQENKVLFLQEKRKNLQLKKKKEPKPLRLPSLEFKSQQHKLCYLGLPRIYQKLFI
jgi:hypothetical protein